MRGTAGGGESSKLVIYKTTSVDEKFYLDPDGTLHYYYTDYWQHHGTVHKGVDRWVTVKAGETWVDTTSEESESGGDTDFYF